MLCCRRPFSLMTWFGSLDLSALPALDYKTLLAAHLNSPPPRRTTWGHLTFHTAKIPCRTPLASAEMTILVTGKTYFASSGKLTYTNYINLVSTRAPLFSSGDQQLLVVLQSSTNLPAPIFTHLETCDAYDLNSVCQRLHRTHSCLLYLRYLS